MKKKLQDWVGEDWVVEFVDANDSRLPENSHACIRDAKYEILVSKHANANMIYCLMHEVGHHALKHLDISDDEKEELLVDRVALVYTQFLQKMGINLAPLVKGIK